MSIARPLLLAMALAGALPVAAAPAARAPSRIVALAPSAAEILFALGAGPHVVGVTDAALRIPEAKGKPSLGGFAPDLERVAALRPDLVVVSKDGTDRAAYERLRALGLPIVVTAAASLDGVFADIRAVGDALGERSRAEALVAALSARVARAEAKARTRGTAPRVVALLWPDPPVAAGPATFVGDLLRRAGARNLVGEAGGAWPRLSLETLASWPLDALVIPDSEENREAFAKGLAGPALARVAAVRRGDVLRIPGDLLERPGPRLVDAFEILVDRLAGLKGRK